MLRGKTNHCALIGGWGPENKAQRTQVSIRQLQGFMSGTQVSALPFSCRSIWMALNTAEIQYSGAQLGKDCFCSYFQAFLNSLARYQENRAQVYLLRCYDVITTLLFYASREVLLCREKTWTYLTIFDTIKFKGLLSINCLACNS